MKPFIFALCSALFLFAITNIFIQPPHWNLSEVNLSRNNPDHLHVALQLDAEYRNTMSDIFLLYCLGTLLLVAIYPKLSKAPRNQINYTFTLTAIFCGWFAYTANHGSQWILPFSSTYEIEGGTWFVLAFISGIVGFALLQNISRGELDIK